MMYCEDGKIQRQAYDFTGDPDIEYQLAVQAVPRVLDSRYVTDKERQIMRMKFDDCMSNKAIAAALGLSAATVTQHLQRAYGVFRELFSIVFPRFADDVYIGSKTPVDILQTDNRGAKYAR